MTKLTLGSYPHMLGFEQLERLLERTAKSGNEGYPPYNIEQTSERSAKDLPKDVQSQIGKLKKLYAVHSDQGERLALVKERNLAFVLARQNDLSPVTAH
ncbi:MAG: DUF1150 family protein [Rhodobacteraceae bacterium]|nr:DUF1150 family protein [Paracoccaceae bacterium]